jgi:hypothetical protein
MIGFDASTTASRTLGRAPQLTPEEAYSLDGHQRRRKTQKMPAPELARALKHNFGDRRMKKAKKTLRKGYVGWTETFDEFLSKDGLLAETEEAALKEIIADEIVVAMKPGALGKDRPWPHACVLVGGNSASCSTRAINQ